MSSWWSWLSEVFWADRFWLLPGVTWADVTNGPDKKVLYPETKDFLYQIPLTVMFILIKYALEKFCFLPLGQLMGVKDKKNRSVQDIPLLEAAYRKSPKDKDVTGLAKQLDMSERQVERWWRLRRNADKPSKMTKFCEHAWKVTCFGSNSLIGFYIMRDKDYFWNVDNCFIGYPHQGITNDVWWFCTLYISFTWSTVFTVFFDVRRKDFVQSVVHHLLTALLLSLNWITGLYRIMAVAIPTQDASEAFLEISKALKAANFKGSITQFIFFMFAVVWFYTRVYIFIFYIWHGSTFTAYREIGVTPINIILYTLLLGLLVLQVYWSMLILQMIRILLTGGVDRDVRSSSSEVSDSQLSDNSLHNVSGKNLTNGTKENYSNSINGVDGNGVNGNGVNGNGVDENGVNGNGIISDGV